MQIEPGGAHADRRVDLEKTGRAEVLADRLEGRGAQREVPADPLPRQPRDLAVAARAGAGEALADHGVEQARASEPAGDDHQIALAHQRRRAQRHAHAGQGIADQELGPARTADAPAELHAAPPRQPRRPEITGREDGAHPPANMRAAKAAI